MNRWPALLGSGLLLSVLVIAMVLTAVFYVPQQSVPTHVTTIITAHAITSVVTTTSSTTVNATELTVMMDFPNGSTFDSGILSAGTLSANATRGEFFFPKIAPGTYPLALKNTTHVYLLPTNLKLRAGLNYANVTVYQMNTFVIYLNNGLSMNGTQPGPAIIAHNASAVELVIINNSTLIHNVGVVMNLGNASSLNILFNSLSLTLSAGGSTNDTFIVTRTGNFYYEDLIGDHALAGDYGFFYVYPF